jgi:Asp-tRNA(Asn)/Glu-tRNA(Gln) amidotransferase A subunit family amidase
MILRWPWQWPERLRAKGALFFGKTLMKEEAMANKEQKRKTREAKKPKQKKTASPKEPASKVQQVTRP